MTLAALIPAANDDYSLALSVPAIAPYVDEVVVLDDASIDQTPQVLRGLGSRFPHLRTDRSDFPLGWTAARNRLLTLTRARHLLFIDADDVFCEWQADALRQLIDSPRGHVRLGLVEAVADFRHGTGRGLRKPHHDPCHCYIDRRLAGRIHWRQKHTYSYVATSANLHKGQTEEVLFCHAKGVKSDWRLCWRGHVRRWLRMGWRGALEDFPETLHQQALRRLFHSRTDPIRRLPPDLRLPEACRQAERFEVLYCDGRIMDRIDREVAP